VIYFGIGKPLLVFGWRDSKSGERLRRRCDHVRNVMLARDSGEKP
jgi:hypothetical protein